MPSGLNDREEAFEAKFKHDEEMQFKRTVKAVKIFGRWAAAQLGLTGAEAEAYAGTVVEADFSEPGLNDVLKKVAGDFTAKKIIVSDHMIKAQLDLALRTATEAMMKDVK